MLGPMNVPACFARLVSLCVVCASLLPAHAATPVIPDKRDGQVLEVLLLSLLNDPKFNMTRTPTNGAVIVLHVRTPEKTGLLQTHQIRSDVGSHTLPGDAERDLRLRNSSPNGKSDTYNAITASFTNLSFGAGIAVADLTEVWSQRRSYGSFSAAHPKACGWAEAYLPGYSKDGLRAIVRAGVGPSAHGAVVTALLEKIDGRWVVKWHHIASYV